MVIIESIQVKEAVEWKEYVDGKSIRQIFKKMPS